MAGNGTSSRRPKTLASAPIGPSRIDSVYYAHAMPLYGTPAERAELEIIRRHFPESEIVDPGTIQSNVEKRVGGMTYCLGLVDSCAALAYSAFHGQVTAGVGKEVNHALRRGKPVFQVLNRSVRQRVKPVKHLSVQETLALYWSVASGRKGVQPLRLRPKRLRDP